MWILLVLVVALIAFAFAAITSAVLQPRIRRAENLTAIGAYGYAGGVDATPKPRTSTRKSLDKLATSLGDFVAKRRFNFREEEIQRELIAAGFYRIGTRRFLGYRALLAIAISIFLMWLAGLSDPRSWIVVWGLLGLVVGWVGPNFYLHRRAKQRLRAVDDALPALIDLLVVTLEAGIAFNQALRMASERIDGPLGEEVRLTIQEQIARPLDARGPRELAAPLRDAGRPSFVRAMVQGDRLGVSIGQILRNQAIEMRARQRHVSRSGPRRRR